MPVRDFQKTDRAAVLAMVDDFYHSSAVDHDIPLAHFANAFDDMCAGGTAYLRGLLVEHEGAAAGFCSLAFTYSTEAGGLVVLVEEVYILPRFRGHGLGEEVFTFIKNSYRGRAARLRLELAPGNTRAMALYERLGFKALPYVQMTNEDF